MAGITLAQAEAQLATWLAASTAVAAKQSYTIGSRTLTLANSREIREQIEYWDRKVKQLDRGSTVKARLGTPIP